MGYCMNQRYSKFFISAKNKDATLEAIKGLAKQFPDEHFSWVTPEQFLSAKTLEEAMDAWRWEIDLDEKGNVEEISFCGEKIGDDKLLFDAIAPWVKKGSYIEMQGEDGEQWRWNFDGKTCKEQNARIVWD